jgi:putative transcriptional regulator
MSASVFARSGAAVAAVWVALLSSPSEGPHSGRLAASAVQLRRGAVRELAAGKLLVAARNLPDPNFAETVVLLAEFSPEAAMGLIVNRQTDVTLGRLMPGLQNAKSGAAFAFFGGPVAVPGVLALLRSATARGDTRHIVGDVYLANTREVLDQMLSSGVGQNELRVYVGYAGWGPGQLERETAAGSWYVLEGSGDVVFDADPDTTWQRQIRRTEGLSVEHLPGPTAPLTSGGAALYAWGRASALHDARPPTSEPDPSTQLK